MGDGRCKNYTEYRIQNTFKLILLTINLEYDLEFDLEYLF